MSTIQQLLNPDQATEREDIFKLGRDFLAACIDYRRRYPQTGSEETTKMDVGLDEFVEFLRPRLDLTGLMLRVPALKRKRSEVEDSDELEGVRPKRVKSEPIMPPLPMPSPQLQSKPLKRSYAFYGKDFGDHPEGRRVGHQERRQEFPAQSSNPPGASSSLPLPTSNPTRSSGLANSNAELDAAEVLTNMRSQPSSGHVTPALVPPPAALPPVKPKGRKPSRRTRPATPGPSMRRSARLRKEDPQN